MLLAFLFVAAAPQALGMRPTPKGTVAQVAAAKLLDFANAARSDPSNIPTTALQEVASVAKSLIQEGNSTDHLTPEDQAHLHDFLNIIEESMIPTLDKLQREERELLDTVHADVTECNGGMTSRLDDDGDIGAREGQAWKYRGEEQLLAQHLVELRNQNTSNHDQLAAFMTSTQPPQLCNSFPTLQIEEVWAEYYKQVDDFSAIAAIQAKDLLDRRSERDRTVALLIETNEKHTSVSGSLGATFCDWKSELTAACATHDECYIDKSARLDDLLKRFNDARDQRIKAYKAVLSIIDSINAMIDSGVARVEDDAESRFPLSGLDVPAKAQCDLSAVDGWGDAAISCGADSEGDLVAASAVSDLVASETDSLSRRYDPYSTAGSAGVDPYLLPVGRRGWDFVRISDASGAFFNTPGAELEDGVKVWNLDNFPNSYMPWRGGTKWKVGRSYTHCCWIKWRESDNNYRTVFRVSEDASIAVKPPKELGMKSINGGFRGTGYNIEKGSFQLTCVVGVGAADGVSTHGISNFFVGSAAEAPTLVGQVDRTSSGTSVNYVGSQGQGPGKLARMIAWNEALQPEQLQAFWKQTRLAFQ